MSDEDNEQKLEKTSIIIKKSRRSKHAGAHGGSWKIAYADFVTALMTFFLLMWLLSMLNKYQLKGVSEYFKNPSERAFMYQGKEKGVDSNVDKDKNKEKYENKPQKIDENPTKNNKLPGVADKTGPTLAELKADMEKKISTDPELYQYRNQLNIQVTADGLKIELRDLENKPMFTKGKADFQKYSQKILSWLSEELNQLPNQVIIIGHTDAGQYNEPNYSNWELSVDRANAARRALINAGMQKDKILRVIGVGERDLIDTKDPLDPINRRIEIIVLTDKAAKEHGNY